MLAKTSTTPRLCRIHALSLTFFASKLAPTLLAPALDLQCAVTRWRIAELLGDNASANWVRLCI